MSEVVLPSSFHRDTTVVEASADKTTRSSLSHHTLGFHLAESCVDVVEPSGHAEGGTRPGRTRKEPEDLQCVHMRC